MAFLIDLYASSNRIDPDIVKFRALVRTLLKPRKWSRKQLATLLADEVWSNWFSVEQKTKLSNLYIREPEMAEEIIQMAWSPNEALATQWKMTFESLKLWVAVKSEGTLYWLPMVWPSYLVGLRWQLLMSTRSRLGPRIILPTNMIGFPITAMLETKIALGDYVFSATIHFLLPEEDVLRY